MLTYTLATVHITFLCKGIVCFFLHAYTYFYRYLQPPFPSLTNNKSFEDKKKQRVCLCECVSYSQHVVYIYFVATWANIRQGKEQGAQKEALWFH